MSLRLVNEANMKIFLKRNKKRIGGNLYKALNEAVTELLKGAIHQSIPKRTVYAVHVEGLLMERTNTETGEAVGSTEPPVAGSDAERDAIPVDGLKDKVWVDNDAPAAPTASKPEEEKPEAEKQEETKTDSAPEAPKEEEKPSEEKAPEADTQPMTEGVVDESAKVAEGQEPPVVSEQGSTGEAGKAEETVGSEA